MKDGNYPKKCALIAVKVALRKGFSECINQLSAKGFEEPSEVSELLSKSASNWMWVIKCSHCTL